MTTRRTKQFVTFLVWLHVVACIWYFLGSTEPAQDLYGDTLTSWYEYDRDINLEGESYANGRGWEYVRSVYAILVTTATVGYGGMVPIQPPEIAICMFMVLFGALIYWLFVSIFAVVATYNRRERLQHTQLGGYICVLFAFFFAFFVFF